MALNDDPCNCEQPDCQSCSEEQEIVDIPEPPCEIIEDLCDTTDEILDNLECCPVDTGIGSYVLSEVDKIELKRRMAENLVEQSRCGDYRGILVFNSCAEMSRYTGDCLCPLKEGTLALVYNKDTMCFELWTAFLRQSGTNDVDCSDGQTMVSVCQSVIWRSYEKCHEPEVVVAPEEPDEKGVYGNKELDLNKANQIGLIETTLGEVLVAPVDGVYHITGNVTVALDCPTGSANGFFRWGTKIFVGGLLKQNNGYQGFAGDYKREGQLYQASAQVGIVVELKKGDSVALHIFEYTAVGFKYPDKTDWHAKLQWHKL